MPKKIIMYLKFLKFVFAIWNIMGRGLNARDINTSVDKSKLNTLFENNLEETKEELKKINS